MVLNKLCIVWLHLSSSGMIGICLSIKDKSGYSLMLNCCKLCYFQQLNYYIQDIAKDISHFTIHIQWNIYNISSVIHLFVLNTQCKGLGMEHIDLVNLNTFDMRDMCNLVADRLTHYLLSPVLNLLYILYSQVTDLLSYMSIRDSLLVSMNKQHIDHLSCYKFELGNILSIGLGQELQPLVYTKMFQLGMMCIHYLSPCLYIIYKNYHISHKCLQLFEYVQRYIVKHIQNPSITKGQYKICIGQILVQSIGSNQESKLSMIELTLGNKMY